MLLDLLVDERPGDLSLAMEAAGRIGGKFVAQMRAGMASLEPALQARVRECVGEL